MKKILAVLLVAVMAFALSACGGDKESEETVYTLRFAHGSSTSEPIHIAAEYMAEELEERSDGRIKVEIYPSATLADQVPACEMLMDGTLAVSYTHLHGKSAAAYGAAKQLQHTQRKTDVSIILRPQRVQLRYLIFKLSYVLLGKSDVIL